MTWKKELQEAITDSKQLATILALDPDAALSHDTFPVRVPLSFVRRMKKGDPQDPLLQQVAVRNEEWLAVPGYVTDPLQEKKTNPVPGLLHKYHGRVLLTLTGSCAINCRYCFRRHFPYSENNTLKYWAEIVAYLQRHTSISEVIFSGGDPLLVDDDRLYSLILDLEAIPHLTTLRIHTRLPVVIPSRITPALLSALKASRLQSVMVMHMNHPQEINDELENQLALIDKKIVLLNQSVLLKGINDSVTVLEALSKRLFAAGVLPYYLHQLDPVLGAHHFEVPIDRGLQLMAQLRSRLPGYLVPRYVQELANEESKVPLT